jgi:hypothetical protein
MFPRVVIFVLYVFDLIREFQLAHLVLPSLWQFVFVFIFVITVITVYRSIFNVLEEDKHDQSPT